MMGSAEGESTKCQGKGEGLGSIRGSVTFSSGKGYVRQTFVAQRGTGVRERAKGGYRSPLCNPRSRPATSPLRGSLASISSLQVGRDTASCLSRPQARVHAGLTWLVNYASAMLMPDTTPRLTFLCFH